jgi:putative sugar O-methyltransferase
MINKFLNYFKYSYHRPTAKLEHVFVLIFKLFLNKKTFLFSEKLLLLKFPPFSTVYLNSFGRALYAMTNFFTIIFFSKFADKSLIVEKNYKNQIHNVSLGNNFSPWPKQALHIFEKTEEVNEDFLEKMILSYNQSANDLKKKNFKDSPWWMELRKEFNKIFVVNNSKVNKKNLINFRNDIDSKAAILKDQNIAISNKNSNMTNMINATLLACLYHKYSEVVDLDILRMVSESIAGNNKCVNYRGQRLNHRILRYTYYLSQLKNNLDLKQNEKFTICDIGGGYGGLLRLLKHYYKNSCCILVELPETCLLASYFIKKNFPDKKILLYSDLKKIKYNLNDYDFVIIPQHHIEMLHENSIDLMINTSSLSEMDNATQDFYTIQIEKLTKKYFYSVNRHKHKMHKYNAQGFYNLKFKKHWHSLIYKFTHTYQLEFLGEKKDN